MKQLRLRPSLLAILFVGFGFTAVSTRAAETFLAGQEAAARMEAAQNEVANVRSNIFITLVELDRVRGERDLAHPKWQVFTNQLARMEQLARAFGQRAEQMKERGTAYFSDWEARTAAIKDPAARKRAEERFSERKASYDAIGQYMQDARKNFTPFIASLNTIKTTLEKQRDEKTIAQAKQLMMQANWRCIDVQRALMQVEAEFDKLAASFAKDVDTKNQP